MALSRLEAVAARFVSDSEALLCKFLEIIADANCTECQSAGYGEAILTPWLQTYWGNFNRELVVASALGTRRKTGSQFRPVSGVKSQADAERNVSKATRSAVETSGTVSAVWHAPWFAILVGSLIGLRNLAVIEASLGPTLVPRMITDFRNYLVHPADNTRQKYEALQAKLGMLNVKPENLLHQQLSPGLPVFASWVKELQGIAHDATR